ncbi:MAG TPA: BTAD domain-containing putative transcriptional regulator [Acidimicrobiales bacterium]
MLGPIGVASSGRDLTLGGPRQRLVLAVLVLNAGRVVPAERLVDEIWGEVSPSSGTGPLRTYVWQLRRLLGSADEADAGPLVSRASGYLLDIEARQVDCTRFERDFADARAAAASGQPGRALEQLTTALGWWRGPAFGELASEPPLRVEATRLDQLHLGAQELRAELVLATGAHAEVTDELHALARDFPHRERLWALAMIAFYRSGRQADALRCYQEARRQLVEEMGIEPGPELRELEQAVLRQDRALDWRPSGREPTESAAAATTAAGASDTALHNLPRQLTSFIGREAERSALTKELEAARLVTLAGTGGCGKTRLALALAEDVIERFPGGVWFVDLAAVSDPALLARALAGPLGVETEQEGQLDHVCGHIGETELLVVLDNCEHLVEAAAEVAEQLLLRCPGLRILATSREELRLGPELVWRVPALSLPEEADVGHDPGRLLQSEAVQLFVERGRSALAGFAPTGDALGQVAQICRRLDGIPLAIELAAALVGSLPVADVADRLDDRFRLLDGGTRRGIARHRTLHATLDWSFDLLDEPARDLFVRLGVFVGDFTLAAAETVGAADDSDDDPLAVARGLGHLVATSMVGCVSGSEGADRYRLLETIRQYARERLERRDDVDEIRWRYARYYADLAAEAERHVHGPAAPEWLARVQLELPNLRAAVAWALAHDDLETGMRLAGALRWFFARMRLLDEAAQWLEAGLDPEAGLRPELRLMALTAASTVAWMQAEFDRTRQLGEEGIALARQLDDDHQLAIALIVRGAAVVYEGDLQRAEECFVEARALCARLGDRWGLAWMLTCWATASRRAGRPAQAMRQLQESLELFRALHDRHGQVMPLVQLALAAQQGGDIDHAFSLASEGAALAAELGDRQLQHVSVCVLGRVELTLDRLERARELLLSSVRDFRGAHNWLMMAIAVEGLAELSARAGESEDAAVLWGFTQQLRERRHISLSGARARERDEWLERARAAVGADRVAVAIDRGRSLDLDDAVRLAEAATAEFATSNGHFVDVRSGPGPQVTRGSALPS